jgi:hypothetical protein
VSGRGGWVERVGGIGMGLGIGIGRDWFACLVCWALGLFLHLASMGVASWLCFERAGFGVCIRSFFLLSSLFMFPFVISVSVSAMLGVVWCGGLCLKHNACDALLHIPRALGALIRWVVGWLIILSFQSTTSIYHFNLSLSSTQPPFSQCRTYLRGLVMRLTTCVYTDKTCDCAVVHATEALSAVCRVSTISFDAFLPSDIKLRK